MIPNLTHIIVLVLDGYLIKKLPSSVGQLKYLRYLDIENTDIRKLPDSITKLYNLQTLRCSQLRKLPKKLGNLINMRHMISYPYGTPNMDHRFIGIERLTCLQTLTYFVVGRDKELRLENLGGLNNLKGNLSIYGLDEVTNMGDASKANLSKKSKIQCLEFHWKDVDDDNHLLEDEEYNDDDVLEGLEPPAYLKRLNIRNFKGKKFSSWMITESRSSVVLQNLVDILRLAHCNRCEGIPPLGHLPNLKLICVTDMRNVKRIGEEFYGGRGDAKTISIMFPSLKTLTLQQMPKLEEWMEAVTVHDPLPPTQLFPCLEALHISCDSLMILPSHFPSLKTLDIKKVNIVALEKICTKLNCLTSLSLYHIRGGSLEFNSSIVNEFLGNNKSLRDSTLTQWEALPAFLAIENQQVSSCPNPSSISAPVSTSLVKLEDLSIGPFLEDLDHFPWPVYGFSFGSSLNTLHLIGWSRLKSLPEQLQHLSSLTRLGLDEFDGLEALPDWLGNLSSLRVLNLWRCRNLVRMPTLEAMKSLRNLKHMWIHDCELLSERCATDSGPEWYKIAHIPGVFHD